MSEAGNKVVVMLDGGLIGAMVESTKPCSGCGETYAIIQEGTHHKLEVRCSQRGLVNTLKRVDVFDLVRELRARRLYGAMVRLERRRHKRATRNRDVFLLRRTWRQSSAYQ
jgi:hypothetical protein